MSAFGGIEGLLAQGAATGVGVGIGIPLAGVLEPTAVDLVQNAWGPAPIKVLDVQSLAQLVAQELIQQDDAYLQANATGISNDRLDLLTQAELRAPGVGELLSLIRRSTATDAEITHALRKAQVEPTWDDRIKQLAELSLTPAEVATAIHRNIIPAPDLIVTEPPTTPGNIPQVPQSSLDPLQEAAWWGTEKERLRVLVGITGLPLSLGEMLQLYNRNEVTEDDVKRAVAQSNLRNEYMDAALGLARRLLTPHEYAEAELRGIMDKSQAKNGASLSGLNGDDYDTLFATVGRPLNVHAITTGLARGGDYGGDYSDVPEPYRDAIRRSATRPEYAKLAYANRYNYPSAFVLRSLVQSGELTADEGKQTLLEIGWPPALAEKVATAWGGGTTAATDPFVKKAETQLWTKVHTSYVDQLSTDAEAGDDLAALGVAADAIPQVLALWQRERTVTRRSLTPAQIKKAVKESLMTSTDAMTRLLDLGYDQADATTLLAE